MVIKFTTVNGTSRDKPEQEVISGMVVTGASSSKVNEPEW